MTQSEYYFCEERWTVLFYEKQELQKKLEKICKEFNLINSALNNPKPIAEIEFPYTYD